MAPVLLANGRVLAVGKNGTAYLLDAVHLGHVSAVAAGRVWYLGYDGGMRAIDPADGSIVFALRLGKPASRFITLCAANGRLFVADGRKVVAVSLR